MATLVALSPVAAVHGTGAFELDGNPNSDGAHDWAGFFPTDDSAILFSKFFAADGRDVDGSYLVGGKTKDIEDLNDWRWTSGADYPPKNELTNTFAVGLETDETRIVFFGADRLAGGQSTLGFWFLQERMGPNDDGTFSARHRVGDLLVVSDFTSGGRVSSVIVYKWVGGATPLVSVLAGADCREASPADDICGRVNLDAAAPAWPYPTQEDTSTPYPATAFFEGGVDLRALGGGSFPCFFTLLTETRSSPELTAQLKDFTMGSFSTCFPDLNLAVIPGAAIVDAGATLDVTISLANDGDAEARETRVTVSLPSGVSVTSATTGGEPCTVDAGTVTCLLGTLPAGDGATIDLRVVPSTSNCGPTTFSAVASTPDEPRIKLADNSGTGSVYVYCSDVSLGPQVGGDIVPVGSAATLSYTLSSNGPDPAEAAWLRAALPFLTSGWTITSGFDACTIAADVLACAWESLAAGETRLVTVKADTGLADCGAAASTATSGARLDTDPANNEDGRTLYVYCSDLALSKTPGAATIPVGEVASFRYGITSSGPDAANQAWMEDPLPILTEGWTITTGADACTITNALLQCAWDALAAGESLTVVVEGITGSADCGTLGSTATGGADVDTDDANNAAHASLDIDCAQPPPRFPCPHSQGYWKTHGGNWPVDSLTLGSRAYTKTQAIQVLNTPPKGDATLILAHQLIAAKVNVANGAEPGPVDEAITEADGLLTHYPVGSKVKTTSEPGARMTALADHLDNYNNRVLTPDCA